MLTRLTRRPAILIILGLLLLWLYFAPVIFVRRNNVINLKKLLVTGISVSILGGNEVYRVIQEHKVHESSKGKTKEGINDPVTNADYKSHCIMYYGIKDLFPNINVISEENINESICNHQDQNLNVISEDINEASELDDEFVKSKDITVWIDPLDATQEYTENLLHFVSTMVCIAVNGKPIIGIIHEPFKNIPRTSWGWSGKTVSSNLKNKSQKDYNKNPILIVSRSHAGKIKKIINKVFDLNVKIITAGGSGYKVLQLLNNNATAYIHSTTIKKWDICAGNAILNAVGGRMSTLSHNEDIDYSSDGNVNNENGILATAYNHDWYFDKLSSLKQNAVH